MTNPTFPPQRISRRELMTWFAAATTAAACSEPSTHDEGLIVSTARTCEPSRAARAQSSDLSLQQDPFGLGVASGDPLPDRVILWTRLVPGTADRESGAFPLEDLAVEWDIALDDAFERRVGHGTTTARADLGHSIHVDAQCLAPDTTYYYRFRLGDWSSPIGRTRTLPSDDARPSKVAFAVACCQHWEAGYFTAHAHLADEADLSFVLFLGDYIYESGLSRPARAHDTPEPFDLAGYRARYEQYKGDRNLQAAHAAHPWLLIWDDHEVDNNYADDLPGGLPDDQFLQRRAAAYQAFYEHHAIRIAPPDSADMAIHRRLQVGQLARFALLDTRQYRDPIACDGRIGADCADLDAPDRSLLGAGQREWLVREMALSPTDWNLIVSQVPMSELTLHGTITNPDAWDGYTAERQHIIDELVGHEVPNVVVLSGDMHVNSVMYVTETATDHDTPPVFTEVMCGSVTSSMFSSVRDLGDLDQWITSLPHIEHFDTAALGYTRCDLTPDRLRIRFRQVDTVTEQASAIRTQSTWVVQRDGVRARALQTSPG